VVLIRAFVNGCVIVMLGTLNSVVFRWDLRAVMLASLPIAFYLGYRGRERTHR
jgi:hypothetical protein